MVLLGTFKNIFKVAELRRKIFFLLGTLIIYRIGSMIPVLGVNVQALADYMARSANLGMMFNYLDTFSGSALGKCTLFALGISPYITASIMMQLLGMTMPSLEALTKEGEYGRKVINQYTRYLTLALSIIYASSYAAVLESQGLVLMGGFGFRIPFILSLTAGAMFVMWLGEQISIYGIGNGASVIIFAGIVARFPDYVLKTIDSVQSGSIGLFTAGAVWLFLLAVMAIVVYVEKGERKIPVQYARRVVGNRIFGAQSTYIPFKINAVGVMPVIFASSILQMPMYVLGMLSSYFPALKFLPEKFLINGAWYNLLTFVLILFFTYFYTALVFDPNKLAQDMKKSGGFILGLRPGKKTAEYLEFLLNRLGLIGALYLAFLAILPNMIPNVVPAMQFYIGGTSLLIMVGVALELSSQIEAYLIEHRYEGFLVSGRLKAR